ncbi:hypothetical protein ACLK1Y_10425 [Escherichia coli]
MEAFMDKSSQSIPDNKKVTIAPALRGETVTHEGAERRRP